MNFWLLLSLLIFTLLGGIAIGFIAGSNRAHKSAGRRLDLSDRARGWEEEMRRG